MSVVVHLLTVEAALRLQAAQSLTELLKLRPSPLTVQTLLTDVLGGGVREAEQNSAFLRLNWNSCSISSHKTLLLFLRFKGEN